MSVADYSTSDQACTAQRPSLPTIRLSPLDQEDGRKQIVVASSDSVSSNTSAQYNSGVEGQTSGSGKIAKSNHLAPPNVLNYTGQ